MTAPHRVHMPDSRDGKTYVRRLFEPGIDGKPEQVSFYFTINRLPDGRVGEVFIKADRQGSLLSGVLDVLGIMISLALQHGVPVEAIIGKMRGTRFPPDQLPRYTSVLDLLAKILEADFGTPAT